MTLGMFHHTSRAFRTGASYEYSGKVGRKEGTPAYLAADRGEDCVVDVERLRGEDDGPQHKDSVRGPASYLGDEQQPTGL